VEKKVYYFENKHNFPSPQKNVWVRVETYMPKNAKAIIMLALCPGRCLLHHKGIENDQTIFFHVTAGNVNLQLVNDQIFTHSIFFTKRDYIAVTQF